jgi:hypothetical protein
LRRFTAAGLRGSPRRVPTGARTAGVGLCAGLPAPPPHAGAPTRIDKILFKSDHSQF